MKLHYLLLLFDMAWQIMSVSLIAFGGLAPVLPELNRVIVNKHYWLNSNQFAHAYALSVVAPGPNSIFIFLLGYHIAGLLGAVLGIIAWATPGCLAVYFVGRWGSASQHSWVRVRKLRIALVPCTTGLMLASTIVTAESFDKAWIVEQTTLAGIAFGLLVLKPKLNPLWIVAICGLVGAIF